MAEEWMAQERVVIRVGSLEVGAADADDAPVEGAGGGAEGGDAAAAKDQRDLVGTLGWPGVRGSSIERGSHEGGGAE